MYVETWRYTKLGQWDSRIEFAFDAEELPLVTIFISSSSWTVFTSRRIVGEYAGVAIDLSPLDSVAVSWGRHPKSMQETATGIAVITMKGGDKLIFEFERGGALMGPVQAFKFWNLKYPVLDNLDENQHMRHRTTRREP